MKIRAQGLLATLLLAPLVSGCWAVAVGASSALITSEFADNAHVFLIEGRSAREVWSSAKSTLSQLAADPIAIDDDLRACRGRYDGNLVTVQVATFDVEVVELRVGARKLGFHNGEIAQIVGNRIVRDLEERYPTRSSSARGTIEASNPGR